MKMEINDDKGNITRKTHESKTDRTEVGNKESEDRKRAIKRKRKGSRKKERINKAKIRSKQDAKRKKYGMKQREIKKPNCSVILFLIIAVI